MNNVPITFICLWRNIESLNHPNMRLEIIINKKAISEKDFSESTI